MFEACTFYYMFQLYNIFHCFSDYDPADDEGEFQKEESQQMSASMYMGN